ncbi:PREDICTED: uncharacterized protein C8orf76-like isoform X2 [Priapulus caudatus]|uniref:Uncharacterized protein C8orf76-like isoform X2 n=1 Tax=Priapulus caudatus TaxID=37621 RepID=A0ABM1EGU7_PRICU|nr:PREDICTED: uncharacterized protein C8orf76-like isoform X2 [Priapulus caudatus]
MEFACFEDGIFAQEKVKPPLQKLESQGAKLCEPGWFLTEKMSSDPREQLQACRYRADLYYSQGKYASALEAYERGLEIAPASHNVPRRDMMEGAVRCRLALRMELPSALQICNELVDEAKGADQKLASLTLLFKVQQALQNYEDCLFVVQQCVALYPNSPEFWIKLAWMHEQLYATEMGEVTISEKESATLRCLQDFEIASLSELRIKDVASILDKQVKSLDGVDKVVTTGLESGYASCETSPVNETGSDITVPAETVATETTINQVDNKVTNRVELENEKNSDKNSGDDDDVDVDDDYSDELELAKQLLQAKDLLVCACLLRARVLLRSCVPAAESFAHGRHEAMQEQVALQISRLTVSKQFIGIAAAIIEQEMGLEKGDDCLHVSGTEAQRYAFQQKFENRWFSWVQQAAVTAGGE